MGAVLASGLLAGCMSTPMPSLHVDLPPHWQQEVAARTPAPPASTTWWHDFGDPRLDALVDQALAANPDIAQATARLRAARALRGVSDAPLRPDLHFRTSNPIDPDASASYFVVGFDSTWELGLFGRGQALNRMARADVESARAQLGDARLTVAAEVARQWVLLRAAQQREALLQDADRQREVQARLLDERVRLRLSPPQQAAAAHAASGQAAAAMAAPHADAVAAAQALAVLLGRSEPDAAWLQPGAIPVTRGIAPAGVPADLLRQRPDVLHAQSAVLDAAGELGLAKAEQWPSIAIGGSIIRSFSEAERVSKHTGAIGSIGPLIDIPLFDWGLRHARARAKDEELQAAVFGYRHTVLAAVGEVETVLASLEAQRIRVEQGTLALDEEEASARAVHRRAQLGLASALDTADSELQRDQAAIELAGARADHALAYVALCKALGGGMLPAATTASAGGAP